MSTLTIELRTGRTEEAIHLDTALASGYKAKVDSVTKKTATDIADDWAVAGATDVKKFTHEDGTVDVTYTLTTEIDNPISAIDHGKAVVRKRFAELDAQLEADTTKLRAEAGWKE